MMKQRLITLNHGSGGRLTRDLIRDILLNQLGNDFLNPLADSAILPPAGRRIAFTTDSYIVKPLFFPGGDIGRLAVFGTVNDLSVMGAEPKYLSLGFIIEEGFPICDFEKIVSSIRDAAGCAGVKVVTGDTKVTERGKGDGIYINTSGIGVMEDGLDVSQEKIKTGDRIVVSGTIGDHGAAVMSKREGLSFEGVVVSDCAPLTGLVKGLLPHGKGIRFMRDPTRGGIAGVLNEVAEGGFEIFVNEEDIPVKEEVKGFCEILGIDPLYLACEGRVVIVCDKDAAEDTVKILRKHPLGADATIVGKVMGGDKSRVYLKTSYGTARILDMPVQDNLPRIC